MGEAKAIFQGEFCRTLDERFRLSIPQELADALAAFGPEFVLVKERAGCLSLWPANSWRQRMDSAIELLQAKLKAGKLDGRLFEIQQVGRLLSTRHKLVQLAGRGRLLIPEGFREFLQVASGSDAMVIGAIVCVEIWNPAAWRTHLENRVARVSAIVRSIGELGSALMRPQRHARYEREPAKTLSVSPGRELSNQGVGPIGTDANFLSGRAWPFSFLTCQS